MDDTVKIQLAFNIEFLWITGLFHSSCETCPEEYMKNNYNSIFQTCFMHVSVVTASARGATGEKVGKQKLAQDFSLFSVSPGVFAQADDTPNYATLANWRRGWI